MCFSCTIGLFQRQVGGSSPENVVTEAQGELQCSGIKTYNDDDNMYFQSVEKNKECIPYCLQWVLQKAGGGRDFYCFVYVFSKFHSEFKQKEYSVLLSFGCICRLASQWEPQGYAEQGVEPGVCGRPG